MQWNLSAEKGMIKMKDKSNNDRPKTVTLETRMCVRSFGSKNVPIGENEKNELVSKLAEAIIKSGLVKYTKKQDSLSSEYIHISAKIEVVP